MTRWPIRSTCQELKPRSHGSTSVPRRARSWPARPRSTSMREGAALIAPVLVSVLLAYALEPFVAAGLPQPPPASARHRRRLRPADRRVGHGRPARPAPGRRLCRRAARDDPRDLQQSIERARREADAVWTGPARWSIFGVRRPSSRRPSTPRRRSRRQASRVWPAIDPPFSLRAYLAGASIAVGSGGAAPVGDRASHVAAPAPRRGAQAEADRDRRTARAAEGDARRHQGDRRPDRALSGRATADQRDRRRRRPGSDSGPGRPPALRARARSRACST